LRTTRTRPAPRVKTAPQFAVPSCLGDDAPDRPDFGYLVDVVAVDLDWAGERALGLEEHANGARAWAIEGTGSYGAGLARVLAARGETVLEVGRGPRDERWLRGKDDSLDAIRAATVATTP